jgi:di/tricarboxylate transporter
MKIWHNQKNGFDYRKYRDAVYAMTPNLQISDGKLWIKAKNAAKLTKSSAKLLANNPGNIALAAGLAFAGAGVGAVGATVGGIAVGVTKTIYKNRAKGLRLVAPTVAGFDSWYVRAAFITGLMDLSFFAPGTTMFANSFLKGRFLASPMSKGVMGMGSSLISLGLSGFAVAKAVLNGDEEDVIEQYIPKMLLASPMGIGATSMFAAGRLAYTTIYNPEKYQYDNLNYWQDDKERMGSAYFSAPGYAAAKGTWRFMQKEWHEFRY